MGHVFAPNVSKNIYDQKYLDRDIQIIKVVAAIKLILLS